MKTWIKRAGMVVLVVTLALGVVGTAAAQGPGRGPGRGPGHGPGFDQPRGRMGGYLQQRMETPRQRVVQAILVALRDETGLTWDDVAEDVRDGTPLSEIIAANDMDPDAVAAQVVTDLTADIEQAVAEGQIMQERADVLIAALPDAVDRVMSASLPPTPIRDRVHERIMARVETSLAGVLAEMAGVEPSELLRDALTPPTLAEIAQAQGLDPDAVVAEAEARITAEVNVAVEEGELTDVQAAQLLDGLAERLQNRMNAPLGRLAGPHDGMFGGRGGWGGGMRGWGDGMRGEGPFGPWRVPPAAPDAPADDTTDA